MKKLEIKTLSVNSKKGFSLLSGINRPITPAHVTKMANSVEIDGPIRPVVVAKIKFITGEELPYIVDGQHLYMALLRMGVDIPYMEVEIKDAENLAEALARYNNTSKSWSMHDYIQVWSYVIDDYKKLQHYFGIYDIELSQIAEILMEGTTNPHVGGSHGVSRAVKNGEFHIEDEARGVKLLDYITDALRIVPRMDRVSNKMFISTYVSTMTMVKSYDHARFLTALAISKDKFKLATQDLEAYRKLFRTLMQ